MTEEDYDAEPRFCIGEEDCHHEEDC
jgi:hypothetical protein